MLCLLYFSLTFLYVNIILNTPKNSLNNHCNQKRNWHFITRYKQDITSTECVNKYVVTITLHLIKKNIHTVKLTSLNIVLNLYDF